MCRVCETKPCLMAAIPCQDRSTQCLLCPDDISLCRNEIAHLLLVDSQSGDCTTEHDSQLSPKSSPAGRGRAGSMRKLRRKRPARRTGVNSESTANSAALEPNATENGCLTRRAKHALDRDKAAKEPRQDNAESVNKTPKRRASDSGSSADEDCSQQLMHTDQIIVHLTGAAGTTELFHVDRNENANEEQEGQKCADLNSNACKSRRKRARIVGKRRNVRRKNPTKTKAARTHTVNVSSLKPISATCSPSGLGLVVTYRPVFSQITRKRKARKPLLIAHQPGNANNNVQSQVCLRDFGTSPRTPSPEKQRRRESEGTVYGPTAALTKRPKSSEREHGVKKWLQDIPQPSSPRVRKHRSPSPSRRKKPSTRRETFGRPFTTANLSAAKTAVPGPSWAPDELTQPASRSTSPLFLTPGSRQPRPSTRGFGSPRSLSPKHRPPSPGPNVAEVFADYSAKTKARQRKGQSASLSPPVSSRPVVSEGWEVTRSNSPDRKSVSPRGRRQGGRGSRSPRRMGSPTEGQDHVTQRDQATSVSRTRHYLVPRSRSQTRSSKSSPSPESRESRVGGHRETDRSERIRHHRHRHRHDREGHESQTGAGVCGVM